MYNITLGQASFNPLLVDVFLNSATFVLFDGLEPLIRIRFSMPLMRILVDGYSLLHNWPELAPGQPRHSERARDELIRILTQYHDATGEPITIFFDGAGAPASAQKPEFSRDVEVLFSRAGQTADDMIERAAHRFQEFGQVLVVTDDFAERDTVDAMGGMVSSCANFINSIEKALAEMQDELKSYNRSEKNRFRRPR
jgi:predicted RNA-binding protein with PIN domain